jgi:hypothetical protein
MSNDKRIIETARTKEAINEAAKKGYWPLVKPVIPSPEIRAKYAVLQNKSTGQIEVINDYRADRETDKMVKIIDFQYYYPHQFEMPFAAYLIPKGLKVRELVTLADLIEDVPGMGWNQGDRFRLASCDAVWDGKDFILEPTPLSGYTAIG